MPNFKIKLQGHSMWPTLKDQEMIYYSDKIDDIGLGDIILFKDKSGELVTHRLVSSQGDTKGDASLCLDTKSEDILGVVIGKENYLWPNGQPLKKVIASFSYLAEIDSSYYKRYVCSAIVIISVLLSFLLSSKSTKDHIEKKLELNP